MKRLLLSLFLLTFLTLPFLVSAQGTGLIPCTGATSNPCNFNKLIELAKGIIDFLVLASIPLATISFMYAGFLYLTAGGDTSKVKQAHSIFWKVLWGFIIILSAWLIVDLILKAFLTDDYSFLN